MDTPKTEDIHRERKWAVSSSSSELNIGKFAPDIHRSQPNLKNYIQYGLPNGTEIVQETSLNHVDVIRRENRDGVTERMKQNGQNCDRESPSHSSTVTSSSQTPLDDEENCNTHVGAVLSTAMIDGNEDSVDSQSTIEFATDVDTYELMAKDKEKNIYLSIVERLFYNVHVAPEELAFFRKTSNRLLQEVDQREVLGLVNDENMLSANQNAHGNEKLVSRGTSKRKKKKQSKRKRDDIGSPRRLKYKEDSDNSTKLNAKKLKSLTVLQTPSASSSSNDFDRPGSVTCTNNPLKIRIGFKKKADEAAKSSHIEPGYGDTERLAVAVSPPSITGESDNGAVAAIMSTNRQLHLIKNTDINMYASNVKYQDVCVLCGHVIANGARHYAKKHSETEVYISRISKRMMELCTKHGVDAAERMPDGRYRAFCLFCEKEQTKQGWTGWMEHTAGHTGEAIYECRLCHKTFIRSSNHSKGDFPCQNDIANYKMIIVDAEKKHAVYAYACKICNYIQFGQDRVGKHLREQHDVTDKFVGTLCLRIKLVNMSTTSGELNGGVTKNNNREMYLSNVNFSHKCVLCNARPPRLLSSHYAREHPCRENYVSRLSPAMMQMALDQSCVAHMSSTDRYRAMCLFCEKVKIITKLSWLTHLVLHIGLMLYRCTSCHHLDVMRKAKCCDNSVYEQIHCIKYEDNTLRGYACKICNYVQFSAESVRKHIRHNHDDYLSIEEHCLAVTFLVIDNPRVERVTAERASTGSISKPVSSNEINNDNMEMYLMNPSFSNNCVLCGRKSTNLSKHFNMKHPTKENYLSRLSPDVIEIVKSTSPMKATQHTQGIFNGVCPFCFANKKLSKPGWLSHVALHCGQFAFECAKCHHKDMLSKFSCCARTDPISIYQQSTLNGFACQICNYVQLSEGNLIKHLNDHHAGTNHQYYPITFLTFDEEYTNDGQLLLDDRISPQMVQRRELKVVLERLNPSIVPMKTLSIPDFNSVAEMNASERRDETDEIVVDPPHAGGGAQAEMDNHADGPAPTKVGRMDQPRLVTVVTDAADLNRQKNDQEQSSNIVPFVRIKTEPLEIEEPSTYHTVNVPRPNVNLKPWTTSSATKTADIAEYLLHDAALFALFKCMAKNCPFSAESKENMASHLQLHEQYQRAESNEAIIIKSEFNGMQKIDYLECAYCCVYNATWSELLEHIVDTHSKSIFQCQYCFYRSIDAFSTIVHMRNHHANKESIILMCNGYDAMAFAKQMKDMVRQQVDTIQPIICGEGINHLIPHYYSILYYSSLYLN